MEKIDAHQHFWDLSHFDYEWLQAEELKPICHNRMPEDLQPHLQACGVSRSIFVQTRHDLDENRWALGLCDQHDFLAGVVGWIDLHSRNCEDQLLEFKENRHFLGIRHIVQDEPDEDFVVQAETLRGLKMLEKHHFPFDLLFYVKHLRHASTVAKICPGLPLVINHLAKPNIKDQEFEDWEANFRAAAECPNVYCKLSGMVTEADWNSWDTKHLKPYVEIALETFGPERLMYGSDWPVCELAATYEEVHNALDEILQELSPEEQERIWSGTAKEFYKIQDEGPSD